MADVKLTAVGKSYGGKVEVLKDINLDIKTGELIVFVGPSGCGKSTLTRLIAGLLIPDQGEVRLKGERVVSPRSTVGMAFQNPVLLEWRNILDNVLLPLEIVPTTLNTAQKEERAYELLAMVGLEGFEGKKPSELSGGMRQRASLCRAMVHRPEVLILDEPFGALDAFTREDLWQIMHTLRMKEKTTTVLITHDLRECVFLSDQIVVLSGRPATAQYQAPSPLGADRTVEDLYTVQATELLAELRHQIQIAQGREAAQ